MLPVLLEGMSSQCHQGVLESQCHQGVLESQCHQGVLESQCHHGVLESQCHHGVLALPNKSLHSECLNRFCVYNLSVALGTSDLLFYVEKLGF